MKNRIRISISMFLVSFLLVGVVSGYSYQKKDNHKKSNKTKDLLVSEVYIPKDLDDCYKELNKTLSPKTLKEIKNTAENDLVKYHFGLGTWIRNNWLRRESNLLNYFSNMGIYHRDDMSSLIIRTFWCKLNNKPDNLQERIKSYQEYWEAVAPPKDTTCPDCGYQIKLKGHLGDRTSGVTHFGYCQNDGSLWVFERDKGWYLPTPEQTDLIGR